MHVFTSISMTQKDVVLSGATKCQFCTEALGTKIRAIEPCKCDGPFFNQSIYLQVFATIFW